MGVRACGIKTGTDACGIKTGSASVTCWQERLDEGVGLGSDWAGGILVLVYILH